MTRTKKQTEVGQGEKILTEEMTGHNKRTFLYS